MRRSSSNRVFGGFSSGSLSGLFLGVFLLCIGTVLPATAQQLSKEKESALQAVEDLNADLIDLSMALWDYSELAMLETASAEYLAAFEARLSGACRETELERHRSETHQDRKFPARAE